MKYRPITRRTLLGGIGSVAIGLPLLEEMPRLLAGSGEPDVPVRAINVFFGLGIPAPLQKEGFKGVLEPLSPLSRKLLVLRDVDQVRCDESGINAHYDGASAAFTAEPPDGEAKSGGPSIDQVIRHSTHPGGTPPGIVPTLIAGTFFRRSRVSRYVHSYNHDGTVAARMQERPRDVFDRVYGTIDGPRGQRSAAKSEDPAAARRRRIRQSVLDSVLDQYHHYIGPHSPLGKASKARVVAHLERLREYERRAFSLRHRNGPAPDEPPRSPLLHGDPADPGGEGIDITLEELTTEWRLLADLYALAIQTDRVRFGSLTFQAAGERIRLEGDYIYEGRKIFHFDDKKQHGKSGSAGCSHEWWHQFNVKKKNEQLRAHVHLNMREVAYFLKLLDGEEAREANGRTILENSLVTISTESGDGRHANVKRELSGVFHAITGAGGRFKTGRILDLGVEGLDVYNSMLAAMNASGRLGPADREPRGVDALRA